MKGTELLIHLCIHRTKFSDLTLNKCLKDGWLDTWMNGWTDGWIHGICQNKRCVWNRKLQSLKELKNRYETNFLRSLCFTWAQNKSCVCFTWAQNKVSLSAVTYHDPNLTLKSKGRQERNRKRDHSKTKVKESILTCWCTGTIHNKSLREDFQYLFNKSLMW